MKHLTRIKKLFQDHNIKYPSDQEIEKISVPTLKTLLCDSLEKSSFYFVTLALKEIRSEIKISENETNIKTQLRINYLSLIKTHVPKTQKAIILLHNSIVLYYKKLSNICVREVKRALSRTSRINPLLKGKKLTREITNYHKRSDKEEKDSKRKIEKEQNEKRKKDFEQKEVERQSRKLNYLISQTELFSHFIMHKTKEGFTKTENEELNENEKEHMLSIQSLAEKQLSNINDFNSTSQKSLYTSISKPEMLRCTLKDYQLKGLNWLANLYDQGINGILADDMGLGKTVQAISFLAYLAETENIQGPFIIVTPASTLHNWLQEFEKFLPSFKIVPYWGSITERKLLRKNWQKPVLDFNCVVTSYQIIVSDEKYFSKMRWNYMILDEAQAIKSSASLRWKVLLNIKCRNRLLLTGTPIQNSMQELWALLHFIMPTLFDSHDEFNDWFSKEIESSAESKKAVSTAHLQRLHMILKPFMLRREKKDVKDELGIKIEKDVYCHLSYKQKTLYQNIKESIKNKVLYENIDMDIDNEILKMNSTNNINEPLMNVVMQFRKVCNHPNLFEKPEVKSGFNFNIQYDSSFSRNYIDEGRNRISVNLPKIVKEFIEEGKIKEIKKRQIFCFYFLKTVIKYNVRDNVNFSVREDIKDNVNEDMREDIRDYVRKDIKDNVNVNVREDIRDNVNEDIKDNINFIEEEIQEHDNKQEHDNNNNNTNNSNINNIHINNSNNNNIKMCSSKSYFNNGNVKRCKMSYKGITSNNTSSSITGVITNTTPFFTTPFFTPFNNITRLFPFKNYEFIVPKVFNTIIEYNHSVVNSVIENNVIVSSDVSKMVSIMYLFNNNGNYSYNTSNNSSYNGNYSYNTPYYNTSNNTPYTPCYREMVVVPRLDTFISDSGKLLVLDNMLTYLKRDNHRVLLYFQMTRMIDLMEEYLIKKGYSYLRLDGSSKIKERRDMVREWQNGDIFIFLLSTRAGGLGINLTAADTVIFYDSDWNPTVDQQAMDRAHRLGQTKDVTVYRLITVGSIEEKIMERAMKKGEIQRMVIQGGELQGKYL